MSTAAAAAAAGAGSAGTTAGLVTVVPSSSSTNSSQSRESNRIRTVERKRILDAAARQRRNRKAIESLENDNFHEDPHADLVLSKKLPKFQDSLTDSKKNRKKHRTSDYYKAKYRKTFQQLVEEDRIINSESSNYSTVAVEPSEIPARKFCTVCGFFSPYTCIQCGVNYCSVKCLAMHADTRCLKWTV